MLRLIRHTFPVALVLLLLLAGSPTPVALASGCVVTTTADGTNPVPVGSLRAHLANPNCTEITFDMTAMGGDTITLAGTLPTISRALTLSGPGASHLTLRGNNSFPLLVLNLLTQTVALSGLTLTSGYSNARDGGNLQISGGVVMLADMIVTAGKTAEDRFGGGAAFTDSNVTLTRVVISGNSSTSFGGGLFQWGGVVTLIDSTLRDNTAVGGGGGILSAGTALSLTRSTVGENTVTGSTSQGGGIYFGGGTLAATNSTISGNTAGKKGGGIFTSLPPGSTQSLSFVTLIGNSAGIAGGGLFVDGSSNSQFVLGRSILAGNHVGATSQDCAVSNGDTSTLVSDGYNLVGISTGCPNNNSTDLTLSDPVDTALSPVLADNGGPTPTHALATDSPALNRIPAGYCGSATDQRLVPRAQKVACDIGAYEARFFPLTIGAFGPGGVVLPNGSYQEGAVKSIRAIPHTGAIFSWTLDGQPAGTVNPLLITLDAEHTIIATFSFPAPDPSSGPSPTPSPSATPSPPPSASPAPGATVALTLGTAGLAGGTVGHSPAGTGSGPFAYPPGTVVTLTATAPPGGLFTGWSLDGTLLSWAPTVTLTMDTDHAVVATFATIPSFGDVPANAPFADPIAQLAARGIIKGCDQADVPPLVCPADPTLRAQMAALIVRAIPGWAAESHPNTFTDPLADAELWGRVATLQHYGVAQGYQVDVCQEQGEGIPCFGPLDPVTYGQTLLFIARAMVTRGYWTLQPDDPALFPDLNGPSEREILDHRALVTYVHYAGAPPDVDASPTTPFRVTGIAQGGWGDASSRAWFARALWLALDSYFGTDRLP